MSERLDAALAYAPRALPLEGKRPIPAGWPTWRATERALRDAWRRHPAANVGIRTGRGLAVLDVDRHGPVDGHVALDRLVREHRPLPDTSRVVTGGDGTHLYFNAPLDLRSRLVQPGLELKAAGGQVVAPPSIHPDTGKQYVWHPAAPPYPAELATLPDWLLEPPPAATLVTGRGRDHDDPLLEIPPPTYFEQLVGLTPNSAGKVLCPFHADRGPSLHVYPTTDRGWYCYGCCQGGDIYNLAGLLLGLPVRGTDFLVVQDRLLDFYSDPGRWQVEA